MKKIAIFDMDGTILNTIEDLADTMNYCLRKYGFPERSIKEITGFVGNGIHRLVELAVPDKTAAEDADKIFKTFIDYYKYHCAIKTRPYDGITETIEYIRSRGMITAVVSNKADAAVKSLVEDYFKGLFDYSVGDKEGMRRKPYPDSVNSVLKHFNIKKEDAVYIGDSEVDFQTARNAGMDLIMVGWGFRDEEFIRSLGVEKVLHKPEELKTSLIYKPCE